MTQHRVIAEDSLSAMDQISKILGKDAVILETNKVNGKIEILGSNNIQDIASSNAKKRKKRSFLWENNIKKSSAHGKFTRDKETKKIKKYFSPFNPIKGRWTPFFISLEHNKIAFGYQQSVAISLAFGIFWSWICIVIRGVQKRSK